MTCRPLTSISWKHRSTSRRKHGRQPAGGDANAAATGLSTSSSLPSKVSSWSCGGRAAIGSRRSFAELCRRETSFSRRRMTASRRSRPYSLPAASRCSSGVLLGQGPGAVRDSRADLAPGVGGAGVDSEVEAGRHRVGVRARLAPLRAATLNPDLISARRAGGPLVARPSHVSVRQQMAVTPVGGPPLRRRGPG